MHIYTDGNHVLIVEIIKIQTLICKEHILDIYLKCYMLLNKRSKIF